MERNRLLTYEIENIVNTLQSNMYNATTRTYNGKRIASRELYRYYKNEKDMLDRVKLNEKIQQNIVSELQYSMLKNNHVHKENRQCDVCMVM